MEQKEYSFELGGKPLTFTLTNWAEQTNASVVVRYGDTVVLTTAVMSKEDRESSYFPLTVEYRTRFYASGFIGGGRFMKREGRPSDEETLRARLIDRTLRPLFNHSMRREVQVINTILSYDKAGSPDVLGLLASSLALHISDIPWQGPVAGVRLGKLEGSWVVNPPEDEVKNATADIFVAGTKDFINMIEIGAKEATEKDLLEGLAMGHAIIQKLVDFQEKIKQEVGKEKEKITLNEADEALIKELSEMAEDRLREIIFKQNTDKTDEALHAVKHDVQNQLEEKYAESNPSAMSLGKEYIEKLIDELVHEAVLTKDKRVDGRKLTEIRPLFATTNVLPRAHGSGIFMRGLTHVLSVATLDSPGEEQLIEGADEMIKKPFMHHYNFPPFSTGEVSMLRNPGRREIGHGALAEKALLPLIPRQQDFPYVIRVVTEVLSSNGSSSMASVCGSSLALMDAGIPFKKHVAGIAMGLMGSSDTKKTNEAKILTDIQGPEDHYGDMDFKIAGTRDGVTAAQMDVKINGVTLELIEKTFEQAKKARFEIIDVLEKIIPSPRENISPYAPVIRYIKINPEKIGLVIGAGGRTIREIMAETETEIDVEDDGSVFVSGRDKTKVEHAITFVENITHEMQIGEVFDAKVVKIAEFGAFVELVPGQEALVHISELKDGFVKKVEDVVKTGDRITVKVIKVDDQGKISASAKNVSKEGSVDKEK